MKKMKCPKCSNDVQEDNFCAICGAKLQERCKCWVLKKDNYSCGEESCPGYGLYTDTGEIVGTAGSKVVDLRRREA